MPNVVPIQPQVSRMQVLSTNRRTPAMVDAR
jgi:hypothetical protein